MEMTVPRRCSEGAHPHSPPVAVRQPPLRGLPPPAHPLPLCGPPGAPGRAVAATTGQSAGGPARAPDRATAPGAWVAVVGPCRSQSSSSCSAIGGGGGGGGRSHRRCPTAQGLAAAQPCGAGPGAEGTAGDKRARDGWCACRLEVQIFMPKSAASQCPKVAKVTTSRV